MSNISSSLVGALYNWQLIRLAGENGVAAYGALMYVQFIFVAIFIGYSVGSAPIVSYHYGAGNTDEVRNVLRKSLRLMGVVGAAMVAMALLLAMPLSRIFVGYDADLLAMTHHAFRTTAVSFLLVGFNIYASSFFTALNNGGVSAAISFLRTLVFQAASVLLLPIWFDLDGIWWAVTVAEVCALLLSTLFLLLNRRRYGYGRCSA